MEHTWLEELREFIAIPSVSADPAHVDDVRRAGEWVRDFVKGIGGEAELVPYGDGDLVIGDIPASSNGGGAPTVMIYGHFDVQPPAPLDLWETPPFELTGTALILIAAFVFRNMPVGIRAGLASLAQIDRSLDEASATLGASSAMILMARVFELGASMRNRASAADDIFALSLTISRFAAADHTVAGATPGLATSASLAPSL